MSLGTQRRSRGKRVRSFRLPPGLLARGWDTLRRGDVLLRLGLCLLGAILLWAATASWVPPFSYRTGDVPARAIIARVDFQKPDPQLTREERQRARARAEYVYVNDPQPLDQLLEALKLDVRNVIRVPSEDHSPVEAWNDFWPIAPDSSESQEESSESESARQQQWQLFQQALAEDAGLERFDRTIGRALHEMREHGLLVELDPEHQASGHYLEKIEVRTSENSELVNTQEVYSDQAVARLRERLELEFEAMTPEESQREIVVQGINQWLTRHLQGTSTLSLDAVATKEKQERLAAAVPEQSNMVFRGDLLVDAEQVLQEAEIDELWREHEAYVASLGVQGYLDYSLATFGMYLAMYALCGSYILFRNRKILESTRRFAATVGMAVFMIIVAKYAARSAWQAELIPLLLFAMTVAIAYHHEAALLFSAAVSLVVVITLGQGLTDFVILVSSAATSILLLGHVRSRTKLLYVGAAAGVVGLFTTLGAETLGGRLDLWALVPSAIWIGACAVLTGLLMTGLLPFIEKLFEVQTEISLLELGDAAHPLLQELVRRAPGTYNHSINVASISEAAAEAIGANGLLVRVGAYFHDIGKMLKPGYFIENQIQEPNRHETLMPAMSTLVIIAHVKDGADLARQHRLPQSIVDFILQHHGTTLVEYFYREASRQSEEDPDAGQVDETSFRYPGPKPQSRETGVLMLADAVESASRTLVDPAPARIESLVHDIALKRLLDGQFDECGLTLKELQAIEGSLVKSLIAVYHGRVKYPSQQTTSVG